MSEKKGIITQYNATNRFGYIRPEGGGELTGFYFQVVANGESPPKANDKVDFEAPEPRKNKKGGVVQGNATAVTITERAPEPPASQRNAEAERRRAAGFSNPMQRGGKPSGRGRPGERRGERRGGPGRADDRRGDRRPGGRPEDRRGAGRPPGGRGDQFGRRHEGSEERRYTFSGEPRVIKDDAAPGDRPAGDRRGRPERDFGDSRRGGRMRSGGPRSEARGEARGERRRGPRNEGAPGQRPDEKRSRDRRDARPPSSGPRSRFPLSRELNQRRPDLGICNPALLLEKYIEWPGAAERRGPGSNSGSAWNFEERHNSYFLHHTFGQTFSRFWAHHVPWYALKMRRDKEIETLQQSGFAAASAEIPADLVFAGQRAGEGFGRNHGFAIDRRYGYPVVPAWSLVALIRAYLKTAAAAASSSESDRRSVLDALSSGTIALHDAFPLEYEVRPTIKRVICYPAGEWFAGTVGQLSLELADQARTGGPGPYESLGAEITPAIEAETDNSAAAVPAAVKKGNAKSRREEKGRARNERGSRPMHCLVFDRPFQWRVDVVSTETSAAAPVELAARFIADAAAVLANAKAAIKLPAAEAELKADPVEQARVEEDREAAVQTVQPDEAVPFSAVSGGSEPAPPAAAVDASQQEAAAAVQTRPVRPPRAAAPIGILL